MWLDREGVLDLLSCKKCGGSGYIPEYRHIRDGLCFECWGSGNGKLNDIRPELNKPLQTQIENQLHPSKQNELAEKIASLCKDYHQYDSELKVAEREKDLEDMTYYDIKMNEIITKLYALAKLGKDSGPARKR